MAKLLLLLASLSGFTGVALGAFAAHGLRSRLPDNLLAAFQTGVQYQLWHTAALIGVALLLLRFPDSGLFKVAGGLFVAGIVLFSGSLYVLALSGLGKLGIITPFGGVCFLLAWLLLGIGAWRAL
ncbi:DUF423 domain-containing protein [Halopseudomonas phragmitis]|uniref:DUF423 domain-containing protein n=2 Tax=Pseudomonadaceae TaxID=135621 RepID=A0A1V0B2Z6_9GAMM|nr:MULTISPECIES: DUF423 domain-containing protein [Pseudomonadaceae]AQZ94275.1 hypothetical protein BVH74_05695 [Halopseudomonas phragmitis]RHW21225.1 DUF423 domain-containing protein [Pseudomonas jilinensis]